jgi:N-acetylneuraminic acid mutarotase
MWLSVNAPESMRARRLPLRGLSTAALLLAIAACQDSPTEPEQAQSVELAAPLSAVASNSWLTRANMPGDNRLNVTAATITNSQNQSVLYVFGGRRVRSDGSLGVQLRTVQAYNTATNTWNDKNPSPVPLELTHGARAIGGKIYIGGGKEGFSASSSLLWQYDPATDTWTRKRNLPLESSAGVSGVIGGKLYVLARCEDCENPDYRVPNDPRFFGAYDPATDQWTPLALPAGGRDHQHGAAGVIGGKLYVAGGRTTNALDIYDPATNRWTTGASMGSIRGYTASATVAGKLYVIAGSRFVFNQDGSLGSVQSASTTSRYDPATNTWKNLAPSPRGGAGLSADRVVVGGQPRIDLVGGSRPGNNLQYVP